MSQHQISRSIWMLKLLRRYGRLTRAQINEHWIQSGLGNGRDIPRRTFYNFRDEIENMFHVKIQCDPQTYEYYIEENEHSRNLTSFMVNTQAMNDLLIKSRDVSDLIFLEDIPSARSHLQLVIESLRLRQRLKFDYAPYTRTTPSRDVVIEPYFLKLFKQRWYVTGHAVRDGKAIKTYALDRMLNPSLIEERYEIPADFNPEKFFRDSFGVIFTQGRVHDIKLKVDSRQAKYFRAVPLHHSQDEMIHDTFSIFSYRMKITPDFVQEILSHGPSITVLKPAELKAMVINELQETLKHYTE